MDNNKKNILWVDDDVNRMALLPDRDALEAKGFNIIAIEKVDDFLHFIKKDNSHIDCVIFDMLMATGSLDPAMAKNGTRTGILLYDELQQSPHRNAKVVVYSVHDKTEFESFGDNKDILFLTKDIKSSEFANKISDLVNNN